MGRVSFTDSEQPLSAKEIDAIADSVGLTFPSALKAHYLHANGGAPEPYVFEDDSVSTVVSEVLPLKARRGVGTAVQSYRRLALEKRLIPKHMFPFAVEGGGDYFLVDCSSESGEVFYYRHDTAFENNRVRSLGVDLEGFWDKLKEEE
jgi:hypothetical protein